MVSIKLNKEFVDSYMENNDIPTYGKLAENIGISRSMLSCVLNEKKSPGQKVIGRMMTYFKGYSFDDVFFLDTSLTKGNGKG